MVSELSRVSGRLKLTQCCNRTLIKAAFDKHIDPIVRSAGHIAKNEAPKVSSSFLIQGRISDEGDNLYVQYIFCSGGLGDSVYLRERLESHSKSYKVAQPDQTASSS
jgi:hypothetical protein